jgi:hypothetical protein
MTPITITILIYLVALFLTVATLWPISYPTQTIFPTKTGPQFVWVLIVVVLPFVMLFYFGLAFLIDDTISLGADHLTAREEELSFTEGLVAAVSYVGLSGWLWRRWRNPKAPSTKILGSAIIATVTAFIIVSVIWAENYDQISSMVLQ